MKNRNEEGDRLQMDGNQCSIIFILQNGASNIKLQRWNIAFLFQNKSDISS